jgi:hypothetical protein
MFNFNIKYEYGLATLTQLHAKEQQYLYLSGNALKHIPPYYHRPCGLIY